MVSYLNLSNFFFFSWLDGAVVLWEEDLRDTVPFSSHHVKGTYYQHDWSLLMWASITCQRQCLESGFSIVNRVHLFPTFDTLFYLFILYSTSLYAVRSGKLCITLLKEKYVSPFWRQKIFEILLYEIFIFSLQFVNILNYLFISQYELLIFIFNYWIIIQFQFILLLKFSHLWPLEVLSGDSCVQLLKFPSLSFPFCSSSFSFHFLYFSFSNYILSFKLLSSPIFSPYVLLCPGPPTPSGNPYIVVHFHGSCIYNIFFGYCVLYVILYILMTIL